MWIQLYSLLTVSGVGRYWSYQGDIPPPPLGLEYYDKCYCRTKNYKNKSVLQQTPVREWWDVYCVACDLSLLMNTSIYSLSSRYAKRGPCVLLFYWCCRLVVGGGGAEDCGKTTIKLQATSRSPRVCTVL